MTTFLLYQIKAGLCIMLFIGMYYALFRKETYYRFNRFYLVSSSILSFILPAIQLPLLKAGNTVLLTTIIGAVTVYADKVAPAGSPEVHLNSVLPVVYLGMAFLFTAYLFYQLVSLVILISRRGTSIWGDYRIVKLPEGAQSFSFFNLVFLSPSAAQTERDNQVLLHEMAHVQQRHSLDILILQLIKIFQWFNPFVYFTEKALQETHEYLADMAVLEQDGQSDRYRLLLLTQVFGVQPGIFSFFNHSLIKNRLTMMTKERSPSRNRFKYLAALPLVFILGLLLCCKQNKLEDVAPPPPPPPPPGETAVQDSLTEVNEPAFTFVEVQATFQGGDVSTFRDWVQKNLVYPPEAVKKGIFGKVTVQFAVSSKGKVCDLKVIRGVDPMLDKETIRVMESSPDWVPAKQGGKNVKQQFIIPVVYLLQ